MDERVVGGEGEDEGGEGVACLPNGNLNTIEDSNNNNTNKNDDEDERERGALESLTYIQARRKNTYPNNKISTNPSDWSGTIFGLLLRKLYPVIGSDTGRLSPPVSAVLLAASRYPIILL